MSKLRSPLLRLPEELLLYLLLSLDLTSILRIRQTCKRIHFASLAKLLWLNIHSRDIVPWGLPFASYWKQIDFLTARQLENLVVHMLKLDHRKTFRHPPLAHLFHQRRSVTWVRLVHSQWLLVASSDDITSVIALWSVTSLLSAKSSAPLAEVFLSAPVIGGTIDIDGSTVVVALELCGRTPQIEILSIVKHRKLTLFCRLQTLNNIAHLRFLQGDHIGVSLVNNLNIPSIVNWKEASISRLRSSPDIQGGAVAMYMNGEWIMVVRRSILEVYVDDEQKYRCRKVLEFPHSVGFASFSQISSCDDLVPNLTLCITHSTGLCVYQVLCNPTRDILSLNVIWRYSVPYDIDRHPVLTRCMLGNTGRSASWLYGSAHLEDCIVKFATTLLPIDPGDLQPTVFEWHDVNMPALYALGVYDYDDARGLLVLGNAYGELALYDFSRSNPTSFRHCVATGLAAMPRTDQQILPTHRIPSYPAPPFPTWESPAYLKTDLLQFWEQNSISTVPPGWSRDFEKRDGFGAGWELYFLGRGFDTLDFARDLEYAAHFYGRPIPLMRKWIARRDYEVMIFNVGGLLVLFNSDEPFFYSVNPGITLRQLATSIEQGIFPVQQIKPDSSQAALNFWFGETSYFEREQKGRNRCLELYRRGGKVNAKFLKPRLGGITRYR